MIYTVLLFNEDGVETLWEVTTNSASAAIVEAWRQYRELPFVDNEWPPNWAKPYVVTERPF